MCGVYLVNNKHFLPDRLYHTTDEMFNIMECRGCGLMRLDPRPPDAEMPNYYPDRYWAYGNTRQGFAGLYRRFVLRDHLRFIGKAIQSLEVPKARILDLGCGAGDILAVLRKRGHSAIGMDISHSALRSAAELNVPGTRGSYRQAPFAEGSFDMVLMFHVLEHIPDPDAAIAGARKLLRANGRLLIQVPNADCMQYTFLGNAGWVWMSRAICTITAVRIWKTCWPATASMSCGASIFRGATTRPAWRPAWLLGSIPWPAACGVPSAPRSCGWSATSCILV